MENVTCKKWQRSENWLKEDKHLLMDLVRERVSVIENKNTDTNTNSKKLAAWADLLCSFNSICKGGTCTLPQIKSQWSIIKMTKKKIKSVERKNLRQTGGGPHPTTNPENADDICSWLPNEFVIDTNEFDSDEINQIGEPSQNKIKVDGINKLVNVENKSSDNDTKSTIKDVTVEILEEIQTTREPSITVTEQNLADRVRYILRSSIFDGAELERLRREAVPSSNENATTGGAVPQVAKQPAHVEAAENTPVVADSNDDGTFTQELEIEQMRSTLEEAIMETRSTPLENRPRLPRIALSKRNRAVVRALNPMLVTYLEASWDLCDTDSILFGAALAVCRIIGAKLSTAGRTTGQSSAIPAWRTRIEQRIARARALIGRLICFRSGNTRPRIVRTVRMAFAGTSVSLSQPDIMQKLTERIDDLKQRIAAWGKRIRRYTERFTWFNQNRLFQSDQKRLYKSLERPMVSGTGPVTNQADTVAFWRSLWSEPVNHNEGLWTEVVASQCAGITPMDPVTITPDDVAEAVRRARTGKVRDLTGCITTG
ncbi:unnamed protein product [Parnassius apollo]|uniref:Regulatory protein zeste n=1 Tax=Parnassius apollo TaxID=110799 RepID=A0A8S3WYC4_PARAO|nr:unnamed protein product [Parnassius apollo]